MNRKKIKLKAKEYKSKNYGKRLILLLFPMLLLNACNIGTSDVKDFNSVSVDTAISEKIEDSNSSLYKGENRVNISKNKLRTPIYGWDIYRNLDKLSVLNLGVQTKQFSSFDRTGGNDKDGFDGTYSYLRREGTAYVIAEAVGAGEVQSIWFTRDGGNVTKTGNIVIELDGERIMDYPLQDLVSGRYGEPFVFPFVANCKESSGGVTIKVPMPYKKSMKIMTTHNPKFYHVSYRTFDSPENIKTFDPKYVPKDVIRASKSWGKEDPKLTPDNLVINEKEFNLDKGENIELLNHEGSGQIWSLDFKLENLVGAPPAEVVIDDGRAHVGTSKFKAKISRDNEGIILVRRYDSISTNQTANIYIDDKKAAQWTGQGIVPGGWVEEKVEIPVEFTVGKSEIIVTNEFVSAGMDFSEFRYFVYSIVNGEKKLTDEIDVGNFVAAKKSEAEHEYSVSQENWYGDRTYILPQDSHDEETILKTDELLEGLRLIIDIDGQETVNVPFGQYFGSGLGHYEVASLMYKITEYGNYVSWWTMPYGEKIKITLANESDIELVNAKIKISYQEDENIKEALNADVPKLGYFHAQHNASKTVLNKDWIFLETNGYGKFLGLNHTMDSLQAEGNTRGYLEGDERIYADGVLSPIWHGTGTEDFYEGGWYFNKGVFSNPMNGAPATEAAGMYGTVVQSDTNYRLLIGDAIDFYSEFSGGFEPGPQQNHSAYYSATAFWYGHKNISVLSTSDEIHIADKSSLSEHKFLGTENIGDYNMISTFEGRDDKIASSRMKRDETSQISFSVNVEKDNLGVRILRVSDQFESYQEVDVYVNEEFIGTWLQVLGNKKHRWLEDSFDIPAYYTKGINKLDIRLELSNKSLLWSNSRYIIKCYGRKS